jgi:hypothetical protein
MSKRNRKPSASQRDKLAIATAKILKRKGVLSKQTKLHGGRFISRGTLKKVQELQHAARSDYRAVKVTKDIARKAKAEGYQVVQGNRLIVPSDHEFIKRIKRGEIVGIKPVKGGFMSEVTIPFEADTVEAFIHRLQYESLDGLKLDHEQFAFSFHGNMSYRAFITSDSMRKYLEHYKQDDQIKALKIFRLLPSDVTHFIKGIEYRKKQRRANAQTVQDRRSKWKSNYAARMEKLERVNPQRAAKIRKENAEKAARQREKLMKDPAKFAAYKEKSRKRALEYYHRNKGKK